MSHVIKMILCHLRTINIFEHSSVVHYNHELHMHTNKKIKGNIKWNKKNWGGGGVKIEKYENVSKYRKKI